MRTLRTPPWLMLLPLTLGLAGCASTTGVSSGIKTVASVGDKRFPVVTGEPGASVVADEVTPERPKRPEGRISGRVVDDQGDPLTDVRVRLAVGGAPGGKVVTATTDRTGAFTLNGVRAGSAYTVIAEWEDGQEYLSGRCSVRAPDTDVKITLLPSDADEKGLAASSRPGRVSSISNQSRSLEDDEELDLESQQEAEAEVEAPRVSSKRPKVNEEDLPPAIEAEAIGAKLPSRAPAGPRSGSPTKGIRWRPVGIDGETRQVPRGEAANRALTADAALQDPEAREAGGIIQDRLADEAESDEGPNPLPPALEAVPAPASRNEGVTTGRSRRKGRSSFSGDDPDPLPGAREPGEMSVSPPQQEPSESLMPEPASDGNPLPPALEPGRDSGFPSAGLDRPDPRSVAQAESDPSPFGMANSESSLQPPVLEADQTAGLAMVAESGTEFSSSGHSERRAPPAYVLAAQGDLPPPVEAADSQLPDAFPPTPEETPFAQTSPLESSPFDAPPLEPTPNSAEPTGSGAAADQSVFDIAMKPSIPEEASPGPVVVPETRQRPKWKDLTSMVPKASPEVNKEAMRAAPATASPTMVRRSLPEPRSARDAPPPVKADVGLIFCDYDPKHRKINDFRLPDLEGRPVRFQELDADLVLIDFWGTWCQPCLRSVPHLVELQKRMGADKLKVVGIACEQGPAAERTQKVAEEVRRLGINYPVLMSGMDGPCPMLEALKVQSYPTLILVDRQGRVVWRDQGVTPVTLARLDRVLASAIKSDETRRY